MKKRFGIKLVALLLVAAALLGCLTFGCLGIAQGQRKPTGYSGDEAERNQQQAPETLKRCGGNESAKERQIQPHPRKPGPQRGLVDEGAALAAQRGLRRA